MIQLQLINKSPSRHPLTAIPIPTSNVLTTSQNITIHITQVFVVENTEFP